MIIDVDGNTIETERISCVTKVDLCGVLLNLHWGYIITVGDSKIRISREANPDTLRDMCDQREKVVQSWHNSKAEITKY